jgi:hypothetical protein
MLEINKKDLVKFLKEKGFKFDETEEISFKYVIFKNDDFEVTLTMCVPDTEIPMENLFGREKVVISIDKEVYEWWLREKNCISIIGRY